MSTKITIVMPVYEGVTQLDFTGPYQFLVNVPNAEVVVASVGGRTVTSSGLQFCGLSDLSVIERCDVLCVPGGFGCIDALEDENYLASIRRLAQSARYITSVCTGSLILGAAGLLKGKRAACHWAWRDMLTAFGAIADAGRIVKDGNIITGGGVTAGIDFALALIAELAGPDVAQCIQLRLEYAPELPFNAGRPETAPVEIVEIVTKNIAAQLGDRRERIALAAARLM